MPHHSTTCKWAHLSSVGLGSSSTCTLCIALTSASMLRSLKVGGPGGATLVLASVVAREAQGRGGMMMRGSGPAAAAGGGDDDGGGGDDGAEVAGGGDDGVQRADAAVGLPLGGDAQERVSCGRCGVGSRVWVAGAVVVCALLAVASADACCSLAGAAAAPAPTPAPGAWLLRAACRDVHLRGGVW
jgi:hypothetical protein